VLSGAAISMLSRDSAVTADPTGWEPRMRLPVTMISSRSVAAGVAAGSCAPDTVGAAAAAASSARRTASASRLGLTDEISRLTFPSSCCFRPNNFFLPTPARRHPQ